MLIDTHRTHSISWIDLAAEDLDRQTAFYTDLLGWSTFTVPGTDYSMFMNGEHPVAGVMAMTEDMAGMPSVWSTYVAVTDAENTCALVTQKGGSVLQPPFDIPDSGRIAIVGDPAGAAICLFEGSEDNGIRQMDEPGAPCWFDCFSRDADAAIAFYHEVFGWEAEPLPGPVPYTTFTLDAGDDDPIAGIMAMGDMFPPEVPSHWGVTFSAPAPTDELVAKATAAGATLLGPPMDSPFGRSARLVDPCGAAFAVIDRSTATAG